MPDFESLEAIAQTDALLDAIAGERRFVPNDPDEQALVAILEGWRDGVRRPSTHHVVTEQEAVTALRTGVDEERRNVESASRGVRGLSLVASVAAAVLAIGGFGAVVAGSGPGDSLYGLRTALFGEQNAVRDDRVALAAKSEMAQVQQMIEQGDWEQAQQKLQAVSTQVQSVDDVTTKTDLIEQWNELSAKVGTRDAAFTLPPSTPGVPAAAPPSGVTLMELPSVTSTTATTGAAGAASPASASPSAIASSLALAAKSEMAQVQQMIERGDWEQAQQRLTAVSTQVQGVGDVTTKTDLIEQWNELSAKVGTRDADFTLPPSTPGVPAAPPPPEVTLLELPTVTSTVGTTGTDGTTETAGTTTDTSADATTGTSTTSSSAQVTTTASSAPPSTTAKSPVSSTASTPVATTSPAPAATSSAPAAAATPATSVTTITQAPPARTATSAAPPAAAPSRPPVITTTQAPTTRQPQAEPSEEQAGQPEAGTTTVPAVPAG